jgi:hypothetical protein
MHETHHEMMAYTDQLQVATEHYKSFKHKLILRTPDTNTQLIQAFHVHQRIYIYAYHAHLPLIK